MNDGKQRLFLKSAAIAIGSSSAIAFGVVTSGNGVVQTLHRVEEDVTTAQR